MPLTTSRWYRMSFLLSIHTNSFIGRKKWYIPLSPFFFPFVFYSLGTCAEAHSRPHPQSDWCAQCVNWMWTCTYSAYALKSDSLINLYENGNRRKWGLLSFFLFENICILYDLWKVNFFIDTGWVIMIATFHLL